MKIREDNVREGDDKRDNEYKLFDLKRKYNKKK